MGWWIALDVVLWITMVVFLVTQQPILALICFILALGLALILSGGKFDFIDFDLFD